MAQLILQYVKPELLVLAVVCYLVGIAIKKIETIKDKYIPLILGVFAVFMAGIYVFATSDFESAKNVLIAIFTAIVQGILCAGLSTYTNQLIKQLGAK